MNFERKVENKIAETQRVLKKHELLVRIVCVVVGIALTRMSGSAHWSLSSVLNGLSIVLFLYALVIELRVHKQQPSRFMRELLVAGLVFTALMFLVNWLQGYGNTISSINLAVILTYLFYLYKAHIQPRLMRFMKRAQ